VAWFEEMGWYAAIGENERVLAVIPKVSRAFATVAERPEQDEVREKKSAELTEGVFRGSSGPPEASNAPYDSCVL
jgi:hypothetical protein